MFSGCSWVCVCPCVSDAANTMSWWFWLSGNVLVSINKVTLCWASLVLGWVTVRVFVFNQTTKVNSAFHPSCVGKSSISLPGWSESGGRTVWSCMSSDASQLWDAFVKSYRYLEPFLLDIFTKLSALVQFRTSMKASSLGSKGHGGVKHAGKGIFGLVDVMSWKLPGWISPNFQRWCILGHGWTLHFFCVKK